MLTLPFCTCFFFVPRFFSSSIWHHLQVKLLNKLASARASGVSGGSKVLTELVEGLEEPAVVVELRLKIDQSHPDLKGGYATNYCLKIAWVVSRK